jgi:hypothetical protein
MIKFNSLFFYAILFFTNAHSQCVTWANSTSYPLGQVVEYNGAFWESISSSNANVQPIASNTAHWKSVSVCPPPVSSSSAPSSSSPPSSSSISSSSEDQISSSSQPYEWNSLDPANPFTDEVTSRWLEGDFSSKRCELGGAKTTWVDTTDQSSHEVFKCLNLDSLDGSTFDVPANVTRIAFDGVTLCRVVEKDDSPPKKTVIMYVYDHSGSMQNNDPKKVAPAAFKNTLDNQIIKAPDSHAGYLPFNDQITNHELVSPDFLSTSHLASIKTKINSNYNNGTNYSLPIEKAIEEMSDPKYDNFNKAIIFLADGSPGSGKRLNSGSVSVGSNEYSAFNGYLIDQAQKGNYPPIFGIFLGSNTSGINLMKDLSSETGAFAVPISDADQLDDVMDQVLTSIIAKSTPTKLTLGNLNVGIQGASDATDEEQVLIQADSSRHMLMDRPIPLNPGENTILLGTKWKNTGQVQNNQKEEIRFTINVADDFVSSDQEIIGTPFLTRCQDQSKISLVDGGKTIPYVTKTTSTPQIIFKALMGDNDIDSTWIHAYSKGLSDVESLLVVKQGDPDDKGFSTYIGEFAFDWGTADSNNGIWDFNWEDSLYFAWINPQDPRDFSRGFSYAFAPPPTIDSILYYDTDGNGVLDSIAFLFDGEVNDYYLEAFNWNLTWLDESNSIVDIKLNDQASVDSTNTRKAHWSIKEYNLQILTYLKEAFFEDSTYTLGVNYNYTAPSFVDEKNWKYSTSKHQDIDKMSPIIQGSEIQRKFKTDNYLYVYFSEPIDTTTIQDREWLEFTLYNEGVTELNLTEGEWEGRSVYVVEFGEGAFEEVNFNPQDQVRFVHYKYENITDLNGNPVRSTNPLSDIIGQYREINVSSGLISLDADHESLDPRFFEDSEIRSEFIHSAIDLEELSNKNQWAGISFGPLKVPETDTTSTEDLNWNWQLYVFNADGQFITSDKGKINCEDEIFEDDVGTDCKSGRGKQVFLRWNLKDQNNRLAGTGVYILKLIVNGKEVSLRKMGIRRAF